MGIVDTDGPNISRATKKTRVQLQSLETFYSEEKYPKQNKLEEYASSLNLTYNQVRVWFAERRRKERRMHNNLSCSIKSYPNGGLCGMTDTCSSYAVKKMSQVVRQKNRHKVLRHLKSNSDRMLDQARKNHLLDLQTLVSKDYILSKIFRKDGPMLGMDFDFPPGDALGHCTESHRLQPYQDDKQILERKKAMVSSFGASKTVSKCDLPAKKHGMGKGLMTVWRATQAEVERPPTGINCTDRGTWLSSRTSANKAATCVSRRLQQKESQLRGSQKRAYDKRKQLRKVPSKKDVNKKEPHLKDCKLSLDESLARSSEMMILVDDEELELNELQAGPNPLRCSAHLASNGRHGCPLCKDLLARFPPQIVKMKQLFSSRPWDSSPEVVKKLFKVLQFIYSHSTVMEVCPFTVDEFAQAFHGKDSLLLGKVHMALLQFLISCVQKDITSRSALRTSKFCRFLVFLNFVREQGINITFWSQSLNSLTWAEILRQVLIAAGFGAKQNIARRGNCKERNQMEKYGLRQRTLKGELFSLLSKQGSGGLKIAELARACQIVELDLPSTTEELETLIYSTLSSDITLFEKIAPFAYRLRVDPQIKGKCDSQSDTEDSGSVDDDSCDASASCSSDDSEVDSTNQDNRIVKYNARHKKTSKKLTEYTEIDESYTGEAWVQGLMEGEYSNLSIEEKLDGLGALIDLVGACSSLTMKEPSRAISFVPNFQYRGSGTKIKRKLTNSQMLTMPLLEVYRPRIEAICSSPNTSLTDPSAHLSISCTMTADLPTTSKRRAYQSSSSGTSNIEAKEACIDAHPLQCIHLGSDRRYNNYWLFLGPCTAHDPGHRRVYFESSEDGHWEVIDTAEALCALLSILDNRGTREACLMASLENRKSFLCQAMDEYMVSAIGNGQTKSFQPSDIDATSGDGSSPTSDVDNVLTPAELHDLLVGSSAVDLEIGRSTEEKKKRWERFQSYDKWAWNTFYSNLNAVKYNKRSYMESLARCENCHDLFWRDEKHCKTCHTTFEIDFDLEERYAIHIATCREPGVEEVGEFPKHKVLPSQLQILKASIHAIEASMPEAALAGTWNTSTHKLWVKRLRRASSLPELLQILTDFVGAINEDWLCECPTSGSDMAADDVIVQFQTMPQTTSAVALWIFKLDTLIAPNLERIQDVRSTIPVPQLKRRRTS